MEYNYKFTDSKNQLYEFGIRSKVGFNHNLIIKRIIRVNVKCLYIEEDTRSRWVKYQELDEDAIYNIDDYLWKYKYQALSLEFRNYLRKFIKMSAFI